MEDYIIREIDRLGEMLLLIARKLGLLDGDTPDYSLTDVKDEFSKAGFLSLLPCRPGAFEAVFAPGSGWLCFNLHLEIRRNVVIFTVLIQH